LLEEEGGLFDNYTPILKPFLDSIIWFKVENNKWMPRPKKGLDEEIDELLEKIDK
jgi:hypothetical protein